MSSAGSTDLQDRLERASFHEAGHAVFLHNIRKVRVYEITVDEVQNGTEYHGDVQQQVMARMTDEESALCLLAGPLAEIKCKANQHSDKEWAFDLNDPGNTVISPADGKIRVSFVSGGEHMAIEVDHDPFETDLGQVRSFSQFNEILLIWVRATKERLNSPEVWTKVKQLAATLIAKRPAKVLRRELFGPDITSVLG